MWTSYIHQGMPQWQDPARKFSFGDKFLFDLSKSISTRWTTNMKDWMDDFLHQAEELDHFVCYTERPVQSEVLSGL